jgi:hypothetical protein
MALKQPGRFRAVSVVAVLIAASKAASGLSWILAISLLLTPFIFLSVLIFITAIFGDTRFSDRAFRLIHLLLGRSAN